MNIIPTLEGGLRIDAEDAADWALLQHLTHDASDRSLSLGNELGEMIADPEVQQDWKEFVVPELDQQFSAALQHVQQAIRHAADSQDQGAASIWITRDDGIHWFSALNQARLALEDQYGFGEASREDLELLADDTRRFAYIRSQLYCAIQSLLLEHVLH